MKQTTSRLAVLFRTVAAAGLILTAMALSAPAVRAQDAGNLPTKPVTITLSESPVRVALDALFKSAGLNYTIDPAITSNVTVNLKDVPFDVALHAILRGTTPPLQYTVVDGIYQIKMPVAEAPAAAVPTTPAPASGDNSGGQQSSDSKQAVVIYLNYINGALLNTVVGPVTIIPPLLSIGGAAAGGAGGGSNTGSSGGFGGSTSGGFGGSSSGGFSGGSTGTSSGGFTGGF